MGPAVDLMNLEASYLASDLRGTESERRGTGRQNTKVYSGKGAGAVWGL